MTVVRKIKKESTKRFKIGEYAVGGIIKISIKKSYTLIEFLDWNTDEVIQHMDFLHRKTGQMMMFLEDNTSHYYADKVLTWIKKQYESEN